MRNSWSQRNLLIVIFLANYQAIVHAERPNTNVTQAYDICDTISKLFNCVGECDLKAAKMLKALEAKGYKVVQVTFFTTGPNGAVVDANGGRWVLHTVAAIVTEEGIIIIEPDPNWLGGTTTIKEFASKIGGEGVIHKPVPLDKLFPLEQLEKNLAAKIEKIPYKPTGPFSKLGQAVKQGLTQPLKSGCGPAKNFAKGFGSNLKSFVPFAPEAVALLQMIKTFGVAGTAKMIGVKATALLASLPLLGASALAAGGTAAAGVSIYATSGGNGSPSLYTAKAATDLVEAPILVCKQGPFAFIKALAWDQLTNPYSIFGKPPGTMQFSPPLERR